MYIAVKLFQTVLIIYGVDEIHLVYDNTVKHAADNSKIFLDFSPFSSEMSI